MEAKVAIAITISGKVGADAKRYQENEGLPLPSPTNKKYSGKFQLRLGSELLADGSESHPVDIN